MKLIKNFYPAFYYHSGAPAYAQDHQHHMEENMPKMEMQGMYGNYSMPRESSGTSWQPDSTPIQGLYFTLKSGW